MAIHIDQWHPELMKPRNIWIELQGNLECRRFFNEVCLKN